MTATRAHKVLLVIPNLQQGGAERQILELMRRLPERFEPVLCVWNDSVHYRDYLPAGQPRHVLGVSRMGPAGLDRLVRVLDEEKPDILHSYRDKSNFWARLATRRSPVPVVLTSCRNRMMNPAFALAEPFLQKYSDRVLTNSEGIRRELVTWARVRPERIQIVHNFIDLSRFHPPTDEERREARARLALADGELAFLLPGRISLQKNQLGLAAALFRLKRRGLLPTNVRILLAGRERDRLYAALLPRALGLLGVGDVVRRLGTIGERDMPGLYHATDALVLPSLYEGLPNALIEAHASGLPAIVSEDANVDGLMIDGLTGFQHATRRPSRLADAIVRMARLQPEDRRRMGLAGRAHIMDRFHPDRVLAETVALYDGLLREKGLV
jgi:glycosyltransferase involved in cell wall biosynthesis